MSDTDFDRLVSAVTKRLAGLTTTATDKSSTPVASNQEVDRVTASNDVVKSDGTMSLEALSDDEMAIALQFVSRSAPVYRDDLLIEKIEI